MALLLITHDLALVAEAAHHIIVMYAGGGGIRQGGGDFPCAAPSLYPALLRALPEFAADKARGFAAGRGAGQIRSPDRLPAQPALSLRQRALP